jgi:hypothetical protein
MTYFQKQQVWAKRRERIYKLSVEKHLSYAEIGRLEDPPVTDEAICKLIKKYKKQHGIQ